MEYITIPHRTDDGDGEKRKTQKREGNVKTLSCAGMSHGEKHL
jgi:hypothetical protein